VHSNVHVHEQAVRTLLPCRTPHNARIRALSSLETTTATGDQDDNDDGDKNDGYDVNRDNNSKNSSSSSSSNDSNSKDATRGLARDRRRRRREKDSTRGHGALLLGSHLLELRNLLGGQVRAQLRVPIL
jgi:hypothetical protein